MRLIIDNTEEEKIIFYFSLDNKFAQREYKKNKNNGVLFCVDKLLSSLGLSLKNIEWLGVVVGVGRFTGVRLAVTLANTLAYSLRIPVVALPKNFDKSSVFKKSGKAKVGTYIAPTYSAEARIG